MNSTSDQTTTGGTKARNWSITINNPTADDFAAVELLKARPWCKEWVGQLERGDSGTDHIQAALKTDNVRFSQVKKALPRAHIEVARNAVALRQYVQKDETRVSELQRVAVAQLGDLQKEVTSVTLEHLQHKGQWCYYRPGPSRLRGGNLELLYTKELLPENTSAEYAIDSNFAYIEENKVRWFDDAVNRLIRRGMYGAEMFGANQFTRSAVLKYFSSVVIRTHGRSETTQRNEASGASGQGDAAQAIEEID